METKHFETAFLSYGKRVRKKLLGPLLLGIVIILYSYFTTTHHNVLLTLQVILGFGAVYAFMILYRCKEFINRVTLTGDKIIISGYTFNTHWEEEFAIRDFIVQIKSRGNGRGTVEYILRIKSKDQTFDINTLFTWNYVVLLDLFREFKAAKGERIIFDEKYFLDIMEKKANSTSSTNILFGKEAPKQK